MEIQILTHSLFHEKIKKKIKLKKDLHLVVYTNINLMNAYQFMRMFFIVKISWVNFDQKNYSFIILFCFMTRVFHLPGSHKYCCGFSLIFFVVSLI